MQRVILGKSGLEAGVISFGTWGMGGENIVGGKAVGLSGHDDKAALKALHLATELGQSHWDTADVYGEGRAEVFLGEMWRKGIARERITLATKLGYQHSVDGHAYEPKVMRQTLEASLKRLQTDYVDILYFHHCDFGPADRYLEAAISTMRDFKREGKVRAIGVSDWSDDALMRVIDRVQPEVVQSYRNILHDTFESSGLKAYAEAYEVGLVFFSALRHGLLLGREATPRSYPAGDVRAHDPDFANPILIERLYALAQELKADLSALSEEPVLGALLAVVREDLANATVLLGQRTSAHVLAASRASTLHLSPDALDALRQRYAQLKA